MVRFGLLGPLRITRDGHPIHVPADKQRTVLAMLIAHRGRAVPVHTLAEEVWGSAPPRSAVPNLRTYIMQIRRLLRPLDRPQHIRLTTERGGYTLGVADHELDSARFEALAEKGRRAAARQDMAEASQAYRSALTLWQADPLEDVPQGPVLRGIAEELGENLVNAFENHIAAELALGEGASLIEPLRRIIRRHPLRERLRSQLMVSLYRSGDAAAALTAFTDARGVLRRELGMDPGPELLETHQAVLRRAPSLSPARTTAGLSARGADTPRQLPRESAVFLGRRSELEQARRALRAQAGETVGAPVVLFHGPSGTGKSALALRVAHSVSSAYPDGRLYADLRGGGPDARPLGPTDVLKRFLKALGVPGHEIPDSADEAAATYQSVLADRRVLIVLDNVPTHGGVNSLLPAGPHCAVLITGIGAMPMLDAVRVPVQPLTAAQSVSLLAELIGRARVTAEPGPAAEIARLCQGNPLALSIVGARCTNRPDRLLADVADRLRDPEQRLDQLQVAGLTMRSGYTLSLAALPRTAHRHSAAFAFKCLGLLDRPFDGQLAAKTIGTTLPDTELLLEELLGVGLLRSVGREQFDMPVLTRLFARELAAREDVPS
ncbi:MULTISPECIES: BTAD domain-containing putative transcriptional regulator [unclassified Streptomyces]|uniref:AfsR/SARP family transcriptional regulator n=1 Tax=unclassified Streptomyces TaxID=2593676 RepID=UPI001587CC65|nr:MULTISPECIES: BTAD domain-containing putative transcriptional regulator [unclassified Streptomyces]NUV65586.1 AAA family ATPase [Streptomyces sp. CAI-121]NUW12323.1 AAA family ATPase [Streptomyces sp. CAI-68]